VHRKKRNDEKENILFFALKKTSSCKKVAKTRQGDKSVMAMEIGTCTEKKETTKKKIYFSSLKKKPQSCKKVAKTRQVKARLQ
jgi:hypothetical protein